MKTRKIFLLSAIAILALVCVTQAFFFRSNPVEILKLAAADEPDSITITRGDGSVIALAKSGDGWTIGDKKYPADPSKIAAMISYLSSIKVLGTVSGSTDDYERYGLAEGSRVTVSASKAGKVLRTIGAGKNSAATGQSYGIIDGKKDVVLLSGSLRDVFDKSVDDLRKLDIWAVPEDGLTRVEVNAPGSDSSFVLAKAGNPAAWQIAAPEGAKNFALDAGKASAWVQGFAALRADAFAPEGTALADKPVATVKIQSAGKEITFTVHSKIEGPKAAVNGEAKAGQPASAGSPAPANGKYLCTSSGSPYPFYLAEAVVRKLLSPYTSLGK